MYSTTPVFESTDTWPLLIYSIYWTLTTWSQAIEMAEIPAFGAFVGLLPPSAHPLQRVLRLYVGFGLSRLCRGHCHFQIIQPLTTVVYIYILPSGRRHTLNQLAAAALGRKTLSV